ncbi:MAG: hypothetical protein AMJ64_06225 [Betaproteobacteria bacterium SG8_39]|nr:MAG: hypothetical protein AMJ64_06225 [Betaproteobacteria bacterium SG8_39]
MLDVLSWVKKRTEGPAAPKAQQAQTEGLLPDLRDADPVTALNELSGWLDPAGGSASADPKARSEILARVQDAGAAHVAAMLAKYRASTDAKQAARESTWKTLIQYQAHLAHALGLCAKALMKAAYEDAELLAPAEASTARALRSCRTLARICFAHYVSVPGSVWRLAYTLYARAEEIGSAASPVKADADPKKVTTVEQELLRLLMFQMSAPDMMAAEQIEVADRALEQIGEGFTLRPPGVADNPFCFDPDGDAPPRRALGEQEVAPALRYFGPGVGYDALEKIYKQLTEAKTETIKMFGMDIAPRAQVGTVQHLLAFWRAKSPYAPPTRAPASGSLQIVHRYAQIWKQLSDAQHSSGELTLADESDGLPQAPEHWTLREAGGNELGAELAQADGGTAKCGEVVGVSVNGGSEYLVGMIRRMRCEPGGSLHADIAVLSRKPQPLTLREVRKKDEDSVISDAASRQFSFASVRAVILADGSDSAQGATPPNLLLPAESWKQGRIYETTQDPPRYLRGLQVTRHGDDYVRATFEWLPGPG